MLRFSRLKIVSVLLLALAGFVFAAPSLFSPETRQAIEARIPSFIPKWMVPHRAITLGLDLQGGIHLLLEIDSQSVIRTQVNTLRDDVRRVLRDERVALAGGIAVQPRGVQIRITDPAERARVLPKLRALGQTTGNPLMGVAGTNTLDVTENNDGVIQLTLTEAGINDRVRRAVEQTIEVLNRRVNALGTTEPNIQRQGIDRVLVEVPGLQSSDELRRILGSTAKLEFRFVADPGANPADVENIPSRDEGGAMVPVEKRVIVEGEDLVDAQPGFDQRTNEPIINFRFNIRGAQRFGEATSANVGRALAIVMVETLPGGALKKEVISAPRIINPITGGQGQISGRFTVQSANDLAILLRSGALPAALTIIEERTVGPGLGRDSIEAGTKATWIAGVFVVLFMFATYGVFGFIANIALLIHVIFIFALMSLLGATLTLPGIAGIVLTIGTAVDSNVLIYERIREEFKAGRSIVSAIEAGFTRAFATIFDSNSTMAIAAVILFLLGSGPVRGFAVVFLLGILTTVITAVTMTRMMIGLWYHWARPKTLPF